MKAAVKRIVRNENGQVLILVLLLLVIGGLTLTPLLGLMSTGHVAGQVYEKKAAELYAADAGVEDAIWKLQNSDTAGLPPIPCGDQPWEEPFDYDISDVNGKNVQVSLEYLGEGVFKITSMATSADDDTSTTILSYVEATFVEETVEDETIEGNIDYEYQTEGSLNVTGSIQGEAKIYVGGNLTVGNNIEGDDVEVYVKGDLIMTGFGNIEDTAIVCVVGDLYIGHCSEDGVEVYVEGNLIGTGDNSGIENGAKVCVEKNVTVDKIENDPTVCVGGNLTAGSIEGGYIYHPDFYNPSLSPPDCPMCCEECDICCECPLVYPGGEGSGYWEGWEIATYNIL